MRASVWLAMAILAIFLLTAPAPAGAADVAALYRAYWAGMPAGEIRLVLHDDAAAGAYRDEIEIRAEGLPQLLTHFRAEAFSEGRIAAAAVAVAAAAALAMPAPQRYDARYALRKHRDQRLVMRFAAPGGSGSASADGGGGAGILADRGPGDTSRKPPLPVRFRTNVLDPLSALSALRDRLRRGERGPFSLPVYDGARRFDVTARVLPKPTDDPNLHLRLVLSPIAGFKGEASDEGSDPDDAPRPATLTVTGDARLMPLSLQVSLDYLPLDVELERWCGGAGAGVAAACR
jgi:hypothetical protein